MKNNLAELSVIGCLVADRETVAPIMGLVGPDDFDNQYLQDIFKACKELFLESRPVDVVTVLQKLPGADKQDYKRFIAEAAQAVPSTRGAQEYAKIVRDNGKRTRAARLASDLALALQEGDAVNVCQEYAVKAVEALNTTDSGQVFTSHECLVKFYASKTKQKQYIQTGFSKLDRWLKIDRGDYIIVGGRPSSGKTALTLQMMLNMAMAHKVTYFSLETSAEKLTDRMVSNMAGVSLDSIKTGTPDYEAINRITDHFRKLKFCVAQSAGWTVQQIKAEAVKTGAEIIFVDYLGLISAKGAGRYEQTTNTSIDLHVLAQQTGITVVALSQLRRGGGKDPAMDDLRESGQLEQDADAILLLSGGEDEHQRSLYIAKNKDGITGKIDLYFEGDKQRFLEVADGV